jgi:hypothetical protein
MDSNWEFKIYFSSFEHSSIINTFNNISKDKYQKEKIPETLNNPIAQINP